ncbi:hypothetical protein E4T85_17240 [Bacillus stratosphericus]|nr:hypothetical protein E4T85_17240 [Bacillus stratosphericus]
MKGKESCHASSEIRVAIDCTTKRVYQADFDLLSTTFTEDAKADMSPFGPMDGQREIVSLLKLLRLGHPYMQHAVTNFNVKVTGDTATMDIYRVIPLVPTKETLDATIFGARYESRLKLDEGEAIRGK